VYGLVIYTGIETKIMQILQQKKDQKLTSFLKTDRNIIYNSMYILQIMMIGFFLALTIVSIFFIKLNLDFLFIDDI